MVLRELADLEFDILDFGDHPVEGADAFRARLQVLIGEAGERGRDAFDVFVCSPNQLADHFDVARWTLDSLESGLDVLPGNKVLPVRGLWLMKQWSMADFTAAIERLLQSCLPAPDWGTFAYRVGQLVPWEFDYKHDRALNARSGLPDVRISFWNDEWTPAD